MAGALVAESSGPFVSVSPNALARFDVAEGVVAVAGQNTTVDVVAGQSSTVAAGQAPQAPVFRVELGIVCGRHQPAHIKRAIFKKGLPPRHQAGCLKPGHDK